MNLNKLQIKIFKIVYIWKHLGVVVLVLCLDKVLRVFLREYEDGVDIGDLW